MVQIDLGFPWILKSDQIFPSNLNVNQTGMICKGLVCILQYQLLSVSWYSFNSFMYMYSIAFSSDVAGFLCLWECGYELVCMISQIWPVSYCAAIDAKDIARNIPIKWNWWLQMLEHNHNTYQPHCNITKLTCFFCLLDYLFQKLQTYLIFIIGEFITGGVSFSLTHIMKITVGEFMDEIQKWPVLKSKGGSLQKFDPESK